MPTISREAYCPQCETAEAEYMENTRSGDWRLACGRCGLNQSGTARVVDGKYVQDADGYRVFDHTDERGGGVVRQQMKSLPGVRVTTLAESPETEPEKIIASLKAHLEKAEGVQWIQYTHWNAEKGEVEVLFEYGSEQVAIPHCTGCDPSAECDCQCAA